MTTTAIVKPLTSYEALTTKARAKEFLSRAGKLIPANCDLNPQAIGDLFALALSNEPKLLECSEPSIFAALLRCVRYGLDPSGVTAQAHLVPFRDKAGGGRPACTLIVGYRGYMVMAARTGLLDGRGIKAVLVYEGDEFGGYDELNDRIVSHVRCRDESKCGAIIGGYAIAYMREGPSAVIYMSIAKIDSYRRFAKGGGEKVWTAFPDEMRHKTLIRRLCSQRLASWAMMAPVVRAALEDEATEQGRFRPVEEEELITPAQTFLADTRVYDLPIDVVDVGKAEPLIAGPHGEGVVDNYKE